MNPGRCGNPSASGWRYIPARSSFAMATTSAGPSTGSRGCGRWPRNSNGDRPEFYEIFETTMDAVGIPDRRMVDSAFTSDDRAFLERARLIVLAGGDVRLGWNTFTGTGMKDVILNRCTKGAVLVGISAGAVQLGRCGIVEASESTGTELLDTTSFPW